MDKPAFSAKLLLGIVLSLSLGLGVSLNASANHGGAGKHAERGERRGPPPRAFEACTDLAKEAACEIQTRRGNIVVGQCRVPRRQWNANTDSAVDGSAGDSAADTASVQLVCVPERRARRKGRKNARDNELT